MPSTTSDSKGEQEEIEESQYNKGRGLLFAIEFTGLPNSTRKNGKRPVTKKTCYVHEESELSNLLHAAFDALGRGD
ncbi:hypothetical protein R3P38DRAFT_3194975 [Favolaschia claudopus]|uniref:Uncharacterized protein n=1 Tax=Favolaschia claudopus TaxID=2862362 RepID=A0AAW0BAD8_9AGAR